MTNLSLCALEQGTSIFPMLLSFPFAGSHRLPEDWVRRPVRPFPLCLLRFEPIIDSSVPWICFVWWSSSWQFTAFPGVFSLFGQSKYLSIRSLTLTLQDTGCDGGGGAGRFLLPPETTGCNWGRQPRRRLLDCGDSPFTDSLCAFQLSWPLLVDGTVTTSSPVTMKQCCWSGTR